MLRTSTRLKTSKNIICCFLTAGRSTSSTYQFSTELVSNSILWIKVPTGMLASGKTISASGPETIRWPTSRPFGAMMYAFVSVVAERCLQTVPDRIVVFNCFNVVFVTFEVNNSRNVLCPPPWWRRQWYDRCCYAYIKQQTSFQECLLWFRNPKKS